MRVIAGSAKSMPLKTIPGLSTRPTTDRIKETLFNILQPRMCGCRFLDIFAGSGGIGIEALSRGADFCAFIEKNKKAAMVIEENLRFTRLGDRARVYSRDVFSVLGELEGEQPFDCIFMDPPYEQKLEQRVLEALSHSSCADSSTLIIVEASLGTEFDYLEEYGFLLEREKRYKTNKHMFIRKA
ncbi:MAG TPA: 16S rRNA (guanine(966)-N(2))-methyltransferase RsmD [Candidatus Blautia pullicola]|jgi:16S rRNA (guanine966-N2)-methyltransferase|uniref:16S rRNA (Guanine(966)-N(2))-methyltransferase RsmD n=1 Tax=Candidatus Blautia pullicola TaxID=2838498 RepID=A0A9D2FUC7_9FIRM|nr:16S rRNA (guanine(966)-N(2))-methyltransferase RsmD [Candidatus Blautia pullicola]